MKNRNHILVINNSKNFFGLTSNIIFRGIAAFTGASLFFIYANCAFAAEPAWLSDEVVLANSDTNITAEFGGDDRNWSDSYSKTFIISAYYSPVQGQAKYVTGSYSGDIRLNGGGVHGADGTPVYPGMIAAPKSYPFGTKMDIPGIGTVAVHDRGGAIVNSGNRGNAHDRLDVWMGYGDNGLKEALVWGKRTVMVTVYGVDDSIEEKVDMPDTLLSQNNNSELSLLSAPKKQIFSSDLNLGDKGEDVAKLQKILKDLNYYNGDITSVFDYSTYKAVIDFQVSKNILKNKNSFGAGYVGSRTMSILSSTPSVPVAHAKSKEIQSTDVFKTDLNFGDTGADVTSLQEELKRVNLLGIEPTGYYGEITEHAVYKFQQTYNLVNDEDSLGAGIFGPITRSKFNSIVAARLEADSMRVKI